MSIIQTGEGAAATAAMTGTGALEEKERDFEGAKERADVWVLCGIWEENEREAKDEVGAARLVGMASLSFVKGKWECRRGKRDLDNGN